MPSNDQINVELVTRFLEQLDLLLVDFFDQGAMPAELSGALLARSQQLFVSGPDPNLDGLEELLTFCLDRIKNRPTFDIK